MSYVHEELRDLAAENPRLEDYRREAKAFLASEGVTLSAEEIDKVFEAYQSRRPMPASRPLPGRGGHQNVGPHRCGNGQIHGHQTGRSIRKILGRHFDGAPASAARCGCARALSGFGRFRLHDRPIAFDRRRHGVPLIVD